MRWEDQKREVREREGEREFIGVEWTRGRRGDGGQLELLLWYTPVVSRHLQRILVS